MLRRVRTSLRRQVLLAKLTHYPKSRDRDFPIRGCPINESHEHTCDQSNARKRLLFDIKLAIEPVKSDVEPAGCFEDKAGTDIEPEPEQCEETSDVHEQSMNQMRSKVRHKFDWMGKHWQVILQDMFALIKQITDSSGRKHLQTAYTPPIAQRCVGRRKKKPK